MWHWDEFLVGIASAVVATGLTAWLSVLTIFKPMMKSAKRTLETALQPVNEIPDIEALVSLLSESLDEFENDYRRVVVYRALPCELSLQFLKHCFGHEIAPEGIHSLRRYEECIARIIKEGHGSHDKTIFGRTGLSQLDLATRDSILSTYFQAEQSVDTSEIGLHSNFNEIGIVLLGETIEQRRDELKQWKAGFIVVFSQDFKTVRGFRHNVHGHIEHLRIVFSERCADLEKKRSYHILNSKLPHDVVLRLREEVNDFFLSPPIKSSQGETTEKLHRDFVRPAPRAE